MQAYYYTQSVISSASNKEFAVFLLKILHVVCYIFVMRQQEISIYSVFMPLPDVDFALACKEVREARNLSQVEMARRLGVPVRTYRSWEYGDRKPSPEFAYWLGRIQQSMELTQEELQTKIAAIVDSVLG